MNTTNHTMGTMTMAMTMALAAALAMIALAGCQPADTTTPDGGTGSGGTVEATFTSLYADYFGNCKNCHAPGAPGRTSDIEQTLNFSTKAMAYTTIKTGMAAGLTGNHTGCNGAAFLGTTPAKSLILAVLDQPTRQSIDLSPTSPNCDLNSITDATVKAGKQPSAAFVTALKTWITNGALNN
jgi:mono/diheme cytochrome c family protein